MSNSSRTPEDASGRGEAAKHPGTESLAEESMCLLWRCRTCGAAWLGAVDQKPDRCQACGETDLEFAAED